MSEITKEYFTQDPDDRLDYDFDYTDFCGATDTIASATVAATPAGLTLEGQINTTYKVKIWVRGGVKGKDYTLECQATTALGRKKTLYLVIRVRQ